MHQKDFSKVKSMNIHSNVVFSNQGDTTSYAEEKFDGHTAKMVTTDTRGVGKNRNIGLLYASAKICLLADDDVIYRDDLESIILSEFDSYPDADIIIFHLDTDSIERKQRQYSRTRKHRRFEAMPWGGVRIAFRLSTIQKANLWFPTLFGGGCTFPAGEDSRFLIDAKRAGLTFYVSNQTIGTVSFAESSWFTGGDERFFYGKGAFYQAVHPKTKYFWMLYFAYRTTAEKLSFFKKLIWMKNGTIGYKEMLSYQAWTNKTD